MGEVQFREKKLYVLFEWPRIIIICFGLSINTETWPKAPNLGRINIHMKRRKKTINLDYTRWPDPVTSKGHLPNDVKGTQNLSMHRAKDVRSHLREQSCHADVQPFAHVGVMRHDQVDEGVEEEAKYLRSQTR